MNDKFKTIDKINERYKKESKNNCTLSCGSNVDFLNIKKGEKVLDLGCGKGKETIDVAYLTGEKGFVTGLDITEEMIEKAKINSLELKLKNIEFVLGDIERLPFEDNTFDAVMSNCVINHADDKATVFSEIYRVLKTNGRFVISDAVTKKPLPKEIKSDPEAVSECFGGALTKKEYLDIINSKGFLKIEILNKREYIKRNFDFISLTIKAFK
ncbi:MAG: methyltransferase domain-containing protein [Clostridiales bacterium]